MLILVGVTVNVALNGGLFTKASEASKQMQVEADRETLLSAVVAAIGYDGKVVIADIELPTGWTGTNGTYTSPKGNTFAVTEDGKITEGEKQTSEGLIVYDKNYKITESGTEIIFCFKENPRIAIVSLSLGEEHSELVTAPRYYTIDFDNNTFNIQAGKDEVLGHITSGRFEKDSLIVVDKNGNDITILLEDDCIFDLYNPTVSDITDENSIYYGFQNGIYMCEYGYFNININNNIAQFSNGITGKGYSTSGSGLTDSSITYCLEEIGVSFENGKLWYNQEYGQKIELTFVEDI